MTLLMPPSYILLRKKRTDSGRFISGPSQTRFGLSLIEPAKPWACSCPESTDSGHSGLSNSGGWTERTSSSGGRIVRNAKALVAILRTWRTTRHGRHCMTGSLFVLRNLRVHGRYRLRRDHLKTWRPDQVLVATGPACRSRVRGHLDRTGSAGNVHWIHRITVR